MREQVGDGLVSGQRISAARVDMARKRWHRKLGALQAECTPEQVRAMLQGRAKGDQSAEE